MANSHSRNITGQTCFNCVMKEKNSKHCTNKGKYQQIWIYDGVNQESKTETTGVSGCSCQRLYETLMLSELYIMLIVVEFGCSNTMLCVSDVVDEVSFKCSFMFFDIVPQATQEELKAAYRRLCMLYHPDKHRDPELKRQAEQLFNLVHEAYEG